MYRVVLLLTLVFSGLYAQKKVEVFSANMDTNGSYVKADNDVVVLYDGMYLSAQSASFDRDSGVIELYGNVNALRGADYYAMGDYLMLNTKENIRQFRPFFFQEHTDELWISARSAKTEEEEYELHTGVVSSCNPQDPDWTLRFSSGYYDGDNQWMQLYNARLYAGSVPVFYLPYIAYPTDTTRRTGLLRPTFGFSGDEGFMYQQPIYIAESPQWDIELLPQIRNHRGHGLYSKFRFVDSKNSNGSITVGGFAEKSSYQEEFDLKNDEHYGAELFYQHQGFLQTWFDWDVQGSSGIYSDVTYLNDVEYLNLKKNDSLDYATTSQVTSKINLFLNQSEDYYGMYGKYFIDLNKDSNADTIQNLPILQYHRYLNTLWNDHFFYSLNYRGNSYYREEGKNAFQNEMTIPLGLQFPLLDEYLTLSFSENIHASHIGFHGPDDVVLPSNEYSSGAYARDYQSVELNTNLVKAFDGFQHAVSLTAAYQHPGREYRDGFYEDYEEEFTYNRENSVRCSSGPCEYDNIADTLKQASLEFTQFVFTDDEGEKLYHRLRQPIVYEKGYDRYGDLENELRYQITKEFNYYNNTFYNYDRNVFSKTQNSLGYNGSTFVFNLSHLFEDKLFVNATTNVETRTKTSYLTSDARYNYSSRWQFFAGYAYDVELSETKNRHLGLLYAKRCWNVELKYVENIRPTLGTSGEASAIQDKVLYLTLSLNPLGGFNVHYKKSENENVRTK